MLSRGRRHCRRGCVIERPEPIPPHRWKPPPAGLVPLDAPTRALLREGRRRRLPPDRRRRRIALSVVVLLHALFLLALWHEMQPPPPRPQVVHAQLDSALQLRFIPRTAAAAPPPEMTLQSPPHAASRAKPVHEAPRIDAMSARMEASAPAVTASAAAPPAPLKLYDRNGAALMPPPASSTAAAAVPGYVQRKPTGDMQVMRHSSPIDYKANRFEKYFPPPGENAAQAGLRHVLSPLLKKHDVNLPRGVHLKCSLLGGCSDPPAPPPPNDGDERLSMAPAPLAKDPHAKPPPSLETCIAAYRSQGPLPYGCPVDTPARAVDAEVRECIALFRAGKRLKTWCPADTGKRAAAQDRAGSDGQPGSSGG